VDDQLTFNQLIEWNGTIGDKKAGHVYPVKAGRSDGRLILDGSGLRRIAPLPARLVCSGHVFHIQQSVERRGCMVMHLTFVEADRAGKRWRLREAGLFPVKPEATDGLKFLTYTPPQPLGPVPPERHPSLLREGQSPLPVPKKGRWPKEKSSEGWTVATALQYVPRLVAHLDLVDRHVYAMKQALALARVLNRQLIMPRLLCLCERAQQPWDIIPTCIKLGSTTELPFVCPMENFLNVEELEGLWADGFESHWSSSSNTPWIKTSALAPPRPFVTLRPWTLLNASFHAEAASQLGAAPTTRVRWVDAAAAPQLEDGSFVNPELEGVGGPRWGGSREVPLGLTDTELLEVFKGSGDVTLLHLESAEVPFFGGWTSEEDGAVFEEEIRKWVIPGASRFSGSWCCTHSHYQAGTILYKVPSKFPSGPGWSKKPLASRLAALRAQLPAVRDRECYWDACKQVELEPM
jgi:hypothetical protein